MKDNVPEIRPCETLHNNFTLDEIQSFVSTIVNEKQSGHHHHHRRSKNSTDNSMTRTPDSLAPSVSSNLSSAESSLRKSQSVEHPRSLPLMERGDQISFQRGTSSYDSPTTSVDSYRPSFTTQNSFATGFNTIGDPVLPYRAENVPGPVSEDEISRILSLAINSTSSVVTSNSASSHIGSNCCDCSSTSPTPPISGGSSKTPGSSE